MTGGYQWVRTASDRIGLDSYPMLTAWDNDWLVQEVRRPAPGVS